eukprot:9412341-Pyramimonas_sp.AAC.1
MALLAAHPTLQAFVVEREGAAIELAARYFGTGGRRGPTEAPVFARGIIGLRDLVRHICRKRPPTVGALVEDCAQETSDPWVFLI